MTIQGVSEGQSPDLYERLVYPDYTSNLGKISKSIYSCIKRAFPPGSTQECKIVEPGVGGGWITIMLLNEMLADEEGYSKVTLYAVDPSRSMVEKFIRLLEEYGFSKYGKENQTWQKKREKIRENGRDGCIEVRICEKPFERGVRAWGSPEPATKVN